MFTYRSLYLENIKAPFAFETIYKSIKEVSLLRKNKNGQKFRPFDSAGNGNTGFSVYNILKNSTSEKYFYKQVSAIIF